MASCVARAGSSATAPTAPTAPSKPPHASPTTLQAPAPSAVSNAPSPGASASRQRSGKTVSSRRSLLLTRADAVFVRTVRGRVPLHEMATLGNVATWAAIAADCTAVGGGAWTTMTAQDARRRFDAIFVWFLDQRVRGTRAWPSNPTLWSELRVFYQVFGKKYRPHGAVPVVTETTADRSLIQNTFSSTRPHGAAPVVTNVAVDRNHSKDTSSCTLPHGAVHVVIETPAGRSLSKHAPSSTRPHGPRAPIKPTSLKATALVPCSAHAATETANTCLLRAVHTWKPYATVDRWRNVHLVMLRHKIPGLGSIEACRQRVAELLGCPGPHSDVVNKALTDVRTAVGTLGGGDAWLTGGAASLSTASASTGTTSTRRGRTKTPAPSVTSDHVVLVHAVAEMELTRGPPTTWSDHTWMAIATNVTVLTGHVHQSHACRSRYRWLLDTARKPNASWNDEELHSLLVAALERSTVPTRSVRESGAASHPALETVSSESRPETASVALAAVDVPASESTRPLGGASAASTSSRAMAIIVPAITVDSNCQPQREGEVAEPQDRLTVVHEPKTNSTAPDSPCNTAESPLYVSPPSPLETSRCNDPPNEITTDQSEQHASYDDSDSSPHRTSSDGTSDNSSTTVRDATLSPTKRLKRTFLSRTLDPDATPEDAMLTHLVDCVLAIHETRAEDARQDRALKRQRLDWERRKLEDKLQRLMKERSHS